MGVPLSYPFTLTNGTTADATQVMADFNAIITALATAAAASGANNDITSLLALANPIPIAAGGSRIYVGGTSTGSANAQVVATLTPVAYANLAGNFVFFIAGFTNTGHTTLTINGQTTENLLKIVGTLPHSLPSC